MHSLPDAAKARVLFSSVLRREVAVSAIKPVPNADLIAAGVYADHDQRVIGVCYADKALVAYAGAALSLIPADAATEALRAPTLDADIADNFAEVLNVCARLIKMPADGRLTLTRRECDPARWPAVAQETLMRPIRRVDFALDIDRYGKGRFVVALAPEPSTRATGA